MFVSHKELDEGLIPEKETKLADDVKGEKEEADLAKQLAEEGLAEQFSRDRPPEYVVHRCSVDSRYGWVLNVLRDSVRCDGTPSHYTRLFIDSAVLERCTQMHSDSTWLDRFARHSFFFGH